MTARRPFRALARRLACAALLVITAGSLASAVAAQATAADQGTAPEAAAARSVAEVVADIEGLAPPVFDQARRDDAAYMEEYRAAARVLEARRADLALELYEIDPTHPKLGDLLGFRWRFLSTVEGRFDEVEAETERVMAEQQGQPLAAEAAYHGAWALGLASRYDAETFLPAVERFAALSPDDERLGQMLMTALKYVDDPIQKRQLLQRVADGGDARSASMAQSQLRKLEGIGKPFALAFEDVTTGRQIDMADLHGKVVVIDFWATWCKPCVVEMPAMKDLYAEYRELGVEFIGVSLDRSEEDGGRQRLLDFVADNGIEWPQYYQGNYWQSEFSSSWGINSIPAVFVVDQDGKLFSTDARGRLEDIFRQLLGLKS